jgi:hypothetical protein
MLQYPPFRLFANEKEIEKICTQGAAKDVNLGIDFVPLTHTTPLLAIQTHSMDLVNKGQGPAHGKYIYKQILRALNMG